MQIVIDIPEELYRVYKDRPPMLGDAGMDMIAQSIANGIPLPENATNGDVIKTLFPRCMWNATGQDEEWWNAPYEGSDTE